jgi:alcohol dehydrogenase
MPKGLTAATGMDALTHAVEAYLSTASTPVTDASALHAIRLISAYLRTAVNNGQDLKVSDVNGWVIGGEVDGHSVPFPMYIIHH